MTKDIASELPMRVFTSNPEEDARTRKVTRRTNRGFGASNDRMWAGMLGHRAAAMRYSRAHKGHLYVDSSSLRFAGKGKGQMKKIWDEDDRRSEWEEVINYQPPAVDSTNEEVEYSTYVYEDSPPQSFVVSGPLGDFPGPGRRFPSVRDAEEWVVGKYGDYLKRIYEAEAGGRWAFRVRPR